MQEEFFLSAWRKKQAALLYYFSSMEYLLGLQKRVLNLRSFAEKLIDTSRVEGRDGIIQKFRWGHRDTSENWANNGWPFLADFQLAITRDIADRGAQIYHVTNAYQCGRGMAEYSMQWMRPDEQERFDEMFAELSLYARNIDYTMDKTGRASRWDDFNLTKVWQQQKENFGMLPKFSVSTNVVGVSGHLPPRTGVYVSVDDPDAALQFAWTGSPTGKLLECTTFNSLGKAALKKVGRSKLWLDGQAMLEFVIENQDDPDLKGDSFFADSFNPELAPSLVAEHAFISQPTRWYYVDIMHDEFEPIESEPEQLPEALLRFESGSVCHKPGVYFTPAHANSRRRFHAGEVFPEVNSQYGRTIWQWDNRQD
jgi:hypothetical protein